MCPVACYRLIVMGGHSKSGPQGEMLICKGFKSVGYVPLGKGSMGSGEKGMVKAH